MHRSRSKEKKNGSTKKRFRSVCLLYELKASLGLLKKLIKLKSTLKQNQSEIKKLKV